MRLWIRSFKMAKLQGKFTKQQKPAPEAYRKLTPKEFANLTPAQRKAWSESLAQEAISSLKASISQSQNPPSTAS